MKIERIAESVCLWGGGILVWVFVATMDTNYLIFTAILFILATYFNKNYGDHTPSFYKSIVDRQMGIAKIAIDEHAIVPDKIVEEIIKQKEINDKHS